MMADDDFENCPLESDSIINGSTTNTHLNFRQNSFTHMQGDLDTQRLLGDISRNRVNEIDFDENEQQENSLSIHLNMEDEGQPDEISMPDKRYERLLHRANTENLSEISGIGCLYRSGIDRLGRPVVVFCGKWFPAADLDLEKAMLYLIHVLDPIVKGDYVIAYFHTLTSTSNYPPLHWLKEVYNILPYKYKKNLKAFYIVHPTFWTKMVTWWFTTFMAPAIKAKVHSLPGVEHLYSAICKDQLEIPAYITEYDMMINGLHYFELVAQTPS